MFRKEIKQSSLFHAYYVTFFSVTACDDLHWGPNCENDCTCSPGVLSCDPVLGCVTCAPGWEGGYDCLDNINECERNATICGPAADCKDTPGSYECFCHEGFALNEPLGICIGTWVRSEQNLYFSNIFLTISGLVLGLRPPNERRRYFVTTSLIGWAQT